MKKAAKTVSNFPGILGFENFPQGKLLRQKVDFESPIGIAYERCIGYTKPEHSHDRVTISFPRGSSRSFIKVYPEAKNYSLNDSNVHFMTKDHRHEQGSVSSIYDTFAIFPTVEHLTKHLKKLGVKIAEITDFLNTTQSFKRTAVLGELIDRYFICRVLEKSPSAVELDHLESMIMTEVFSSAQKNSSASLNGMIKKSAVQALGHLQNAAPSEETALIRALEFIESHLFEKLDVAALVRSSRTSQATLFRLFKRDLKLSPLEYVRNRRLDEAQNLLKSGEYQVGDVGLLVGYEDLSSFSKAFKVRFKTAPSQLLPS